MKSPKVTLYTAQNSEVYELLKRDGVVYPKIYTMQDEYDVGFQRGNDWIISNMAKRHLVSHSHPGIFWAHTKLKHVTPNKGDVVLKLTKDASELFPTDYNLYHSILNNWPVTLTGKTINHPDFSEAWDAEYDKAVEEGRIEENWDAIMDIYIDRKGRFCCGEKLRKLNSEFMESFKKTVIQVTFSKIKASEVRLLARY